MRLTKQERRAVLEVLSKVNQRLHQVPELYRDGSYVCDHVPVVLNYLDRAALRCAIAKMEEEE